MTKPKKRKPRKPNKFHFEDLTFNLDVDTNQVVFELTLFGDVPYGWSVDAKDMRRISKFFADAADYLEAREK